MPCFTAITAGIVISAASAGQTANSGGAKQAPSTLPKRVDQGVSDSGPLNTSLKQVSPDLRHDDSFQSVYEVPGQPGRFMRSAGGVNAVFNESVYVPFGGGVIPITPAGTIFYIGPPPPDRVRTAPSGPDLRVQVAERIVQEPIGGQRPTIERRSGPPAGSEQVASSNEPGTPGVEDPEYRARLLRRLADAELRRLDELTGDAAK